MTVSRHGAVQHQESTSYTLWTDRKLRFIISETRTRSSPAKSRRDLDTLDRRMFSDHREKTRRRPMRTLKNIDGGALGVVKCGAFGARAATAYYRLKSQTRSASRAFVRTPKIISHRLLILVTLRHSLKSCGTSFP